MTRASTGTVRLAIFVAVLLAFPTIAAASPSEFAGSCSFAGPIRPMPPITVVPLPGAHFSYRGSGGCDGTLDSSAVAKAPIAVAFTDVATLFDTCELGPDFNLSGNATIGSGQHPALFAITISLARVAVAGPFSLSAAGGGQALGVAQFAPSDATAAAQQCAAGGVAAASLSASFNTVSPLVGTHATTAAAPASGATPKAPPASRTTATSHRAVRKRYHHRRVRRSRRCAQRRVCNRARRER